MIEQRRIFGQSIQYAVLWWLGGLVGAPLVWAVRDAIGGLLS